MLIHCARYTVWQRIVNNIEQRGLSNENLQYNSDKVFPVTKMVTIFLVVVNDAQIAAESGENSGSQN